GKTYWIRANEVTGWIPDFVEDDEEGIRSNDEGSFDSNSDDNGKMNKGSNLEGDTNIKEVAKIIFEKEQPSGNMKEDFIGQEKTHSEDPFNIYKLLDKNKNNNNDESSSGDSLKYPPVYTPNFDTHIQNKPLNEKNKEGDDFALNDQEDIIEPVVEINSSSNRSNNDSERSKCSGHFQISGVPRNGGSVLQFLDEVVKVGQTICYNIEGCMKNIGDIIDSQGVERDGEWVPKGKKTIIILVYAPQELKEKKMLWDYLSLVISNWNGDVILMGDFNEARTIEERHGSLFNSLGVDVFNLFILSNGLKEGLKEELVNIDILLDIREGNSDTINKRTELSKSLQELNNLDSLELAQKTKIKWAIEEDENYKYFYGVLNKHRSQMAIREKETNYDFKVNFEKAYDSVRWDYLDDVLKKFGFGDKWCGWIRSCLYSSKGSVIVNGSPTKEFHFHRGLKQGDPLSPFLFLLIMERLHISVQRVVDVDMLRGINIGPSLQLSHLFYADDAIFMGHWSDSNIDTIIYALECFYHASGLRINMNKSKLMGISVSSDKVEQAARKIGMMPIYHMSIFKVPSRVLKKIEYVRCHIFNEAYLNAKKQIWVKWNKVLASKYNGGLGYRFAWFHSQENRWSRSLDGAGDFSVASVRKMIDDRTLPVVSSKARWINMVPIKVNILA
nr:RNA-directed DNA polymerase, eukaryota [Tanacetum cinerariifolium]